VQEGRAVHGLRGGAEAGLISPMQSEGRFEAPSRGCVLERPPGVSYCCGFPLAVAPEDLLPAASIAQTR